MKIYIIHLLKRFKFKLQEVDDDFWDDLYDVDIEEVEVDV